VPEETSQIAPIRDDSTNWLRKSVFIYHAPFPSTLRRFQDATHSFTFIPLLKRKSINKETTQKGGTSPVWHQPNPKCPTKPHDHDWYTLSTVGAAPACRQHRGGETLLSTSYKALKKGISLVFKKMCVYIYIYIYGKYPSLFLMQDLWIDLMGNQQSSKVYKYNIYIVHNIYIIYI